MNKDELSELIGLMDADNTDDGNAVRNLTKLRESYSFTAGFTGRVINALSPMTRRLVYDDLQLRINSLFYKIALTGAAAIIILAVSVFLSGGNISFDSFLGIGNASDESLLSLLTGN